MIELRLTILRDAPPADLLNQHAPHGYSLHRDTQTGLYFLAEAGHDFAANGYPHDYEPILEMDNAFDAAELEAFRARHTPLLQHTLIHQDVVADALALSKIFSTHVLCVYSNDEDCDFAVTAENGDLCRLRFKGGRSEDERLDDDTVGQISTEVLATRMYADGETPDEDGVYKYTAYEVIQTKGAAPALHPYWTYIEGEVDGQVIFKTLDYTPAGVEPHLMFRNAFLEFEAAFAKTPPDFTDIAEEGRFEKLLDHAGPSIAPHTKILNFFGRLYEQAARNRTVVLWGGVILIVATMALLFESGEDQLPKQVKYTELCRAAGGNIDATSPKDCRIGNQLYQEWSLPGDMGERRIMLLKIQEGSLPCPNNNARECINVEGDAFPYDIEGFQHNPNAAQLAAVERIQMCSTDITNGCSDAVSMFKFKQVIDLSSD